MAIIGVSKPLYAVYSASGNKVTYATGGVLGKLTEINLEIEVSKDNDMYADNGVAETDRTFSNGKLTLKPDDLSQEVAKAILGVQESEIGSGVSGVTDVGVKELIYDESQVTPYLGIGFIVKKKVKGVTGWRAVLLTKCMFAVPSDAATTQGESIEWQVPELSATVMRDDSENHAWKKEATFTTEAQAEAYLKARLSIAGGVGA